MNPRSLREQRVSERVFIPLVYSYPEGVDHSLEEIVADRPVYHDCKTLAEHGSGPGKTGSGHGEHSRRHWRSAPFND